MQDCSYFDGHLSGAPKVWSTACLGTQDGQYRHIKGSAVEIASLAGEVRAMGGGSLKAALTGVVADTDGDVFGGPFVAGLNPICMTFEVTLEEWLPTA